MIKHIARLEKYVMGINKEDFHQDIINLQTKGEASQKITKNKNDDDAPTEINKNGPTIN